MLNLLDLLRPAFLQQADGCPQPVHVPPKVNDEGHSDEKAEVPPRPTPVHRHDEAMVLMRTTVEENTEIGRRIMEKLNASSGPVAILFPRKGVSAIDIEGNPFHDRAADDALFAAFRVHAADHVEIESLDMHLNDDAFAAACCRKLLSFLAARPS